MSAACVCHPHPFQQEKIELGNLDAKRDWGYAPEYVEGMWRILQHGEGDDFVLATNETHTVREFVQEAFGHVGLDWERYVKIDPHYFRPTEVDLLVGDASKARTKLDWTPKVKFQQLVQIMVDADLDELKAGNSNLSRPSRPEPARTHEAS